jgi:hypothetical protein
VCGWVFRSPDRAQRNPGMKPTTDPDFAVPHPGYGPSRSLAWLQGPKTLSPEPKNPARLRELGNFLPSLDFWGPAGMFRATFGKSEPSNA